MNETQFRKSENLVYDEQKFVKFPHIFYLDTADTIGNNTIKWVK